MFSSVLLISSNFLDEVWLILFHENLFGNTQKNHCVLERVVKKTPQTIKKIQSQSPGSSVVLDPIEFHSMHKNRWNILQNIYFFKSQL